MGTLVRWILVPVAGVAAWFAAIFTMYAFDKVFWQFDYPCPKDQLISGSCPGISFDWYSTYIDVLEIVGAGMAAIYVVVACTWVAPKHKQWVALAAFAIGASVAGYMGRSIERYAAMTSAVVAGATVAIWLNRRHANAHAS